MRDQAVSAILACFGVSSTRKSRKCKKILMKLQTNISIQRRRRESMVRQTKADISMFLQNGQLQRAYCRAEQLNQDERRLSAYDQIERFSTTLIGNVLDLTNESDMNVYPDDVKEAIASLIFAASRIGELPELQTLRCLFVERFGPAFDKAAVELRPGNVVDSRIKQCLDPDSTPFEASGLKPTGIESVPAADAFIEDSLQSKSVLDAEVGRFKTFVSGQRSLEFSEEKRKMINSPNDGFVAR